MSNMPNVIANTSAIKSDRLSQQEILKLRSQVDLYIQEKKCIFSGKRTVVDSKERFERDMLEAKYKALRHIYRFTL